MLTDEQRQQIEALRNNWFRIATSIERADRPRAKKAVKALAASSGVTVTEIEWVESPKAGAEAYKRLLRGSLDDLLNDLLQGLLQDSLQDPLQYEVRNSVRDSLRGPLWHLLQYEVRYSLEKKLQDLLWGNLRGSLEVSRRSLNASVRNSLENPLGGDSLSISLGNSLRDSPRASLRYSPWDSLQDSPTIMLYQAGEIVGAVYSDQDALRLAMIAEVLSSCFAVWVGPGWAILCDRPTSVEITDGQLIRIRWGD